MINAATPTLAAGRDRKLPIWERRAEKRDGDGDGKNKSNKKSRVLVQGFLLEGGQGRPTTGKRGKREKGHGSKQRGTK